MKKKALPLAVGAATAVVMSSAHAAMYINNGGTGEALVFPFYSAENGNNTNVSIVNTLASTDPGAWKAVKVRIIEGQNSAEVLDFNLYMSPRDHFSFAISATEAGGGMLVTGDNSCTVPAIPAEGVEFRNYAYSSDSFAADADTDAPAYAGWDNTGIERSAIGYIEIIEMGQLDPDSPVLLDDADVAGTINAADAITHDSDGVPANCQLLVDAWSIDTGVAGVWRGEADGLTGYTNGQGKGVSEFLTAWTGGGLYGYASVINVPQGAAFGQDAVAIEELAANGASGSAMHYKPGDQDPNFNDPAIDSAATIFTGTGTISFDASESDFYDDAEIEGLMAVNSLFMTSEVHNDYVTDPVIAATTDWVMTFPTKSFHIPTVATADPIEPFSSNWVLKGYDPIASGQCEPIALGVVDREESTPPVTPPGSDGPDFSPGPPQGTPPPAGNDDVPLCYETTVLQFADETAAGTNSLAIGVGDYLEESDGWATAYFHPSMLDTNLPGCVGEIGNTTDCQRKIKDDGHVLTGLPVVGFAVQKYVNGSAGGAGVLANYAISSEHKTEADISAAAN
jgi:hypothetical protein